MLRRVSYANQILVSRKNWPGPQRVGLSSINRPQRGELESGTRIRLAWKNIGEKNYLLLVFFAYKNTENGLFFMLILA